MKTKRSILAIALTLVFLVGCAKDQIKIGALEIQVTESQKQALARGAGYMAAYLPLKNNPGYLSGTEGAIVRALDRAYEPGVDVALLVSDIVYYLNHIKRIKDFSGDIGVISMGLQAFEGALVLDIELSESKEKQKEMTLGYVRAFLEGAQAAVYDLKG